MEIKLSLDNVRYMQKPCESEIREINNRVAKRQAQLEVKILADEIGNRGKSFCPAIFSGGRRKADGFLEMQLFALDFDEDVSLEEVEERAQKYKLDIAFKYATFSSTKEEPRFRIVFIHDVPVTDKKAAEIIIKMLMKIFPEADKNCKDVSRMFFGGKGVIGEVQEKTIDIVHLAMEFQHYIFDKNSKNYSRGIRQFAKDNSIACENDCLQISYIHENSIQIEGKMVNDQYINRSITIFPSNSPVYYVENKYKTNVRRENSEDSTCRVNLGGIEKKCQLYSDFLKKPKIHHNERFLLLTNMLYIGGGRKRFLSVIKKKGYDENSWRYYAKYVKDAGYKPQSCANGCPYADSCNHKANMLLTVKEKDMIVKIEDEQYDFIENVYDQICASLKSAVDSAQAGIYLVPAQTAIGKTQAYCELIYKNEDRNFIVAVPTNSLKREVAMRLNEYGIDNILVTPSLDEMTLPGELAQEVEYLYGIGLGKQISEVLRKYIKNNRGSQDEAVKRAVYECERYLSLKQELKDKRVVVTTHARLVTFDDDMIRKYEVIIDEDILSTFFKNITIVPLCDVKKAVEIEGIPLLLKERLKQILNAKEGEYERITGAVCYDYIPRKTLESVGISGDINSISVASTFQRTKDMVYYFYPQTLAKGKYIVLSATLDESLYRMYFQGWHVRCTPYYKAKYKGKLRQLTAYSMSRQCISENKEKIMDYLKEKRQGFQIITFLQYEEMLGGGEIHFGNAEGLDILKGQDIMIIGTPHQSEFVYKLLGCHLGVKVNGEVLAVRRVESGGYEFSIMTYPAGELRALQIYFIRKELEQCIGRARLLRSDCKVVVLSNFPCEQAELDQEDYLEEVITETSEACSSGMAEKL